MTTVALSPAALRDAIRPKNFDPAEVVVVDAMDTAPPRLDPAWLPTSMPAERRREIFEADLARFDVEMTAWRARNLELLGREYPGSRCEHCGHNPIRWAYVVKYLPTGQHFIVGEICGDERMTLANRAAFDLRTVRMAAESAARRVARLTGIAKFFADFPAEAAFLYDPDRPGFSSFLEDLKSNLERRGSLTEKQVACVTRDLERAAARTAAQAAQAEALADVAPLAEGRMVLVGEVISTKWSEDRGYGPTYQMLVKLPDGNRIFGSVPKDLHVLEQRSMYQTADQVDDEPGWTVKGATIRFTATVARSENDIHFGFFKRPTKAEVA